MFIFDTAGNKSSELWEPKDLEGFIFSQRSCAGGFTRSHTCSVCPCGDTHSRRHVVGISHFHYFSVVLVEILSADIMSHNAVTHAGNREKGKWVPIVYHADNGLMKQVGAADGELLITFFCMPHSDNHKLCFLFFLTILFPSLLSFPPLPDLLSCLSLLYLPYLPVSLFSFHLKLIFRLP